MKILDLKNQLKVLDDDKNIYLRERVFREKIQFDNLKVHVSST